MELTAAALVEASRKLHQMEQENRAIIGIILAALRETKYYRTNAPFAFCYVISDGGTGKYIITIQGTGKVKVYLKLMYHGQDPFTGSAQITLNLNESQSPYYTRKVHSVLDQLIEAIAAYDSEVRSALNSWLEDTK